MNQENFKEWGKAAKQLQQQEKKQEEFEFYSNLSDTLKGFESYELFIDKWNTPEPNAATLNWYILDDEEE